MQETIEDMLLSGTIKQVETPLEVIKSFSVSVNLKDKTRLILDLRHVNDHLDKGKKKELMIGNILKITYKQIRVTFSSLT